MTLPLLAALLFAVPTLLVGALLGLGLALLRRPQRRYWAAYGWVHLGLFVLHLFVTFPAVLGFVGSRLIGTRPQERSYAGPRVDAAGRLLVQTWDSLAQEHRDGVGLPPELLAAAAARQRRIPSTDGVALRAFCLEAPSEPPRATAVLVHGLFRSAMELEPVAALLRGQGCECWLLELRNHGGSDRRPFTGGLRESDDVVAAARFVRAQPGRQDTPLLLFGVSLGTVAVSLALPRIDRVAGVVLDAPIDDLRAAAQRMLGFDRRGDRRSFFRMVEPWQSLTLAALEQWSGFAVADVAPAEVLATLPHDLPMLIVGAGEDDLAPPDAVEALFAGLPMPAPIKQLWLRPGSGHGHVFLDAPAEYAEHLRALLARLRH